jgi:tripartite-type tricarboxylate transporter receptor subunit TctC
MLRALALFTMAAGLCAPAQAQYPARTVRMIAPFAPAGGTDIMARALAQRTSECAGRQFVEVIRRDLARWQKVIAQAKLRPE